MTREAIKESVLKILRSIAPEVPGSAIRTNAPLREQLEIDSMDFLNFAIRLHKEFGIEIPESDYRLLNSLDDCVTYVEQKTLRAAAENNNKGESHAHS